MSTRAFRTPESYQDENVSRDMLPKYLRDRGFENISDDRQQYGGNTVSQTIHATGPEGDPIAMRVRLCWRRGRASGTNTYSAAQLLSSVRDNDWEGTISRKIQRDKDHGVTHLLFVQREDEIIEYAALVPLSEILSIWCAQRDISTDLLRRGQLGRTRRNHAMNGSSPTIYLQDDRAPQVAAAFWNHNGVIDLAKLEPILLTRLPDHEADRDDETYQPNEGDFRAVIERQIRERRGQQQFRDAMRERFGNRCIVTGCRVLAVLEAAHIRPYRGENDNHAENGLLLRSDIHTLFDLDLLGINPERLVVELHPDLVKEYGHLAGIRISCPPDIKPSNEALRFRYELFQHHLK